MVERILDAALALIEERGVDGATTVAIAERAGLSVGSLYQYFPNVDSIILELARRWLSAFPENIKSRQEEPAPINWIELERQINRFVVDLGQVYLSFRSVLPLLNAMYAKPGLLQIVREHDAKIVQMHAEWLRSINPALEDAVARRLGLVMLEMGHSCMTTAVGLPRNEFELVVQDLQIMHLALLGPHLNLLPDRSR